MSDLIPSFITIRQVCLRNMTLYSYASAFFIEFCELDYHFSVIDSAKTLYFSILIHNLLFGLIEVVSSLNFSFQVEEP